MLTFPFIMTWAELAALPNAAERYSWDDADADDEFEPDLAGRIRAYSEALSPKLAEYLSQIGFTVGDEGVSIRNEQAIHTANTLFNQILFEYDDPEAVRVVVQRYGHEWHSTPTWAMFELGGDDDVDYNGSQPSCLTHLLIANLKEA